MMSYLGIRSIPGSIVVAVLLLFCVPTLGQSGRRATKPPPVSNPTPEPAPTPTKREKIKPELMLIVGMDTNSSFVANTSYYSATVLRSCVDRLDDVRTVEVDVAQNEMGRGEAIRRAKSETEAYVVLLQLLPDTTGANNGTVNNNTEFYLEYW